MSQMGYILHAEFYLKMQAVGIMVKSLLEMPAPNVILGVWVLLLIPASC